MQERIRKILEKSSKGFVGKIVDIIQEKETGEIIEVLQCPFCGNIGKCGTDFASLRLGYYCCKKCGEDFTIFKHGNPKENVKIALMLLNDKQYHALEKVINAANFFPKIL